MIKYDLPASARPVIIVWEDSHIDLSVEGNAARVHESMAPCIRYSIGYLTGRDDKKITIAWAIDGIAGADLYEYSQSFPRDMVRKVIPLCCKPKSCSRSRQKLPASYSPPPAASQLSLPFSGDANKESENPMTQSRRDTFEGGPDDAVGSPPIRPESD